MKSNIKFILWIGLIIAGLAFGSLYKESIINFFTKIKEDDNQTNALVEKKVDNFSSEENTTEVITNHIDATVPIESINSSMVGKNVSIVGEITNRRDHQNGHVFLTVKDSSGEILIPVFSDKEIPHDTLLVGNMFQFSGTVDEYQGQIEIIPSNPNDVMAVERAVQIEEKDEGKMLTIAGKILSKYAHPQGHLFIIVKVNETGQELDIPLFNTLNPNPENYPINSEISINGKVSIYNGKLQLIPNSLKDIQILKMGNDLSVKTVKISEITEADRGKMVIAKGFVDDVVEKDGHIFFKLSDQGNQIKTVLFKADSKEITGRRQHILHADNARFEIRVLGMVDVYNGEKEIIIDKVLND